MPIRILLADDNELYRAAIRQFLGQDANLQIVVDVGDGEIAIREALALQPDVAMLDVEMPIVGGIEATNAVVSNVPASKVLGVSLFSRRSLIQGMIEAGAKGYVMKEDAVDELIPAVYAVAAGGTYFSKSLPPPWGTGQDPDGDPGDDQV